MVKEIIVVEGRKDTVAVCRAVQAHTIETGGSAINKKILKTIALAQHTRGVIILTDPDYAGHKIRNTISNHVQGCKHAFIPQSEATKKGDIGVENASVEAIRYALAHVHSTYEEGPFLIHWEDLMSARLIVHPHAAIRRRAIGDLLHIGYCNGKQLYKKLKVFQISREQFLEAVLQIDQKGL